MDGRGGAAVGRSGRHARRPDHLRRGRGGSVAPSRAKDEALPAGRTAGGSRLRRRAHPPDERRAVTGARRPHRGPDARRRTGPRPRLRRRASRIAVGPRPRLALRLVPRRDADEGAAGRRRWRPAGLHGVLRRPQRLGQLERPGAGRDHQGLEGPGGRGDRARPGERRADRRLEGSSHRARRVENPVAGRQRALPAPAPRAAPAQLTGDYVGPGRRIYPGPARRRSAAHGARASRGQAHGAPHRLGADVSG